MASKDETFLCGMRYRDDNSSGTDNWDQMWGTCTYCGSLPGDEFMKMIKECMPLGVTTKDYKAYIGDHQKFYYVHLSKAEREEFVKLYNERKITFNEFGGTVFSFNGMDCPFPFFMHAVKVETD